MFSLSASTTYSDYLSIDNRLSMDDRCNNLLISLDKLTESIEQHELDISRFSEKLEEHDRNTKLIQSRLKSLDSIFIDIKSNLDSEFLDLSNLMKNGELNRQKDHPKELYNECGNSPKQFYNGNVWDDHMDLNDPEDP